MSALVRTLRFVDADERNTKPSRYWRSRPMEERLAETLKLHREGNELFKGGNPGFIHVMEFRHVPAA
ncbi:MAG: hypothetical protein QM599_00845 [Pseudoxanthomonas sp.]